MNESYKEMAKLVSFFVVNLLIKAKFIKSPADEIEAEDMMRVVEEQFLSFVQPGGDMDNLLALAKQVVTTNVSATTAPDVVSDITIPPALFGSSNKKKSSDLN